MWEDEDVRSDSLKQILKRNPHNPLVELLAVAQVAEEADPLPGHCGCRAEAETVAK